MGWSLLISIPILTGHEPLKRSAKERIIAFAFLNVATAGEVSDQMFLWAVKLIGFQQVGAKFLLSLAESAPDGFQRVAGLLLKSDLNFSQIRLIHLAPGLLALPEEFA